MQHSSAAQKEGLTMTQMFREERAVSAKAQVQALRKALEEAYDRGDTARMMECSWRLDRLQLAFWRERVQRRAS